MSRPLRSPVEELQARRGSPAHGVLDALRDAGAAHGTVTPADEAAAAATAGLPVAAVHGAASYYADLAGARGARHVRVCAGTACFVASGGGGHLAEVERALGVPAGGCAADGSVSLQLVHC